MRITINQVVFQIIKSCDQVCPHCFFNSLPNAQGQLTLLQIKRGLEDLKKTGIKNVDKFIISGGEPLIHPDIILIVEAIRNFFPHSKVRIDTNGLQLFKRPHLFEKLKVDIYDISADIFHNLGILVKEKKFENFFVKNDGSSKLVDFFIKQKELYNFDLNIRWTSNRNDNLIFDKFFKKYSERAIITKKLVTATGRAKGLPEYIKGRGHTIREKPDNFRCLIGDALLLSIDGYWYGCYHPVFFTKLSLSGQSKIFALKLRKLLNSDLAKNLSKKGICYVLKLLAKKKNNFYLDSQKILKTRYWYRCQPCEDACKKNLFDL